MLTGTRLYPDQWGNILVDILDGWYIGLPPSGISEGRRQETCGLWESRIICKEFQQFGEPPTELAGVLPPISLPPQLPPFRHHIAGKFRGLFRQQSEYEIPEVFGEGRSLGVAVRYSAVAPCSFC